MALILPATLAAQIAGEARAAFPRECCGLIEGVWNGSEARAMRLHPAPNRATAMDRFDLDPATHLAAQKSARTAGHAIIGCYHSHPGGSAEPSEVDRAGAAEEDFLWLITALGDAASFPALRAYRYSAARFEEIGVVTGADLVTSSS